MLRKLAPYSRDTIRSLGTGGFSPRLSGFRRLYHGFFLLLGGALSTSRVAVDVADDVWVLLTSGRACFSGSWISDKDLSLSLSTYCKGSVVCGSCGIMETAAGSGSAETRAVSWRPVSTILFSILRVYYVNEGIDEMATEA